MIISLHKNFKKQYNKLTKSQKIKFKERRSIFLQDEFNVILNNHALKGKYQGYRSINVTGDVRVIYRKDSDIAFFVEIGSHSKLYG
ncbi:MAG: type II toxin-antitoxin system mRNA interferase toxin, RelE/StbE family [Candidatus Levybacteria bacterium]|nr:type II toxin-antitoxin system mRNA interferase toxin, RelE/StbE family [Candidatus Levybacteria bacterium]MDZ4228080.1 type II toxin-antitoxin system mRNA interferase toxin, RelE/StbE family [Candidatus Levybacteria bacterium]